MATGNSGRLLDVRPVLTRSRSNTSPEKPSGLAQETAQTDDAPARSVRPGHVRSRSYISPLEKKLPGAATFPAVKAPEKPSETSRFPRLHLHGKHHHTQSEDQKLAQPHRKHRYTQSEVQQYHRKNDPSRTHENQTPIITTTGPDDIPNDVLYPSSRGAAIPSLMRMASHRSYRGPATSGDASLHGTIPLRRRASSDPKSPIQSSNLSHQQSKIRSPIELQVERADHLRLIAHRNATQADIDRLNMQLDHANMELSTRLSSTSRTAATLMRRLDDAHDTLHRTAESLVDTISSFSNLAQQSAKLISNFDTETSHLDSSTRQRIKHFRTSVSTKRTERIIELENRGKSVSTKAEELGRRLENCRTVVRNWEQRETNKRKAWKDVWKGVSWGLFLILVGVLAGVVSWKVAEGSAGTEALLRVNPSMSSRNETLHDEFAKGAVVPEDVKEVLRDIAVRRDEGRVAKRPDPKDLKGGEQSLREDKGLRLLDEL